MSKKKVINMMKKVDELNQKILKVIEKANKEQRKLNSKDMKEINKLRKEQRKICGMAYFDSLSITGLMELCLNVIENYLK